MDIKNCKFAFKCPKHWDDLEITKFPSQRLCKVCHQLVFMTDTESKVQELAKQGKCVALFDADDFLAAGVIEVVDNY